MMNPHRFVCGLIIWLGLAGFLPIAHAVDLAISHLAASSPSGTINPSASGSLPNLTPFRPSGWTDKIVVRNGAGQVKPDIFSTSDTLFLEWAVINNGGTDVKSSYAIDLYVDGVKKKTWEDNDLPAGYYLYVAGSSAYSLGSLGAGTHTLKIVADPAGAIGESDESDNSYERQVTITPNFDGWLVNPANQHRYQAIQCGGWTDCNTVAWKAGAHLVTIGDATEQTWLVDQFNGVTPYWIGLTDNQKEGQFVWITGEPLGFTNWASGQPDNFNSNQDYAYINYSNPGKWDDESNSPRKPTIAILEKGLDLSATTLTVTVNGAGSVAISPAEINCGATCSMSFSSGTSVTLTATPASGSAFMGWGGDCTGTGNCVLILKTNKTVRASFKSTPMVVGSGGATLALRDDSRMLAYGSDNSGELGQGRELLTTVPQQIQDVSDITMIMSQANAWHSLALKRDGTVLAWGSNGSGQLGDGATTGLSLPVKVSGLTEVTAVAVGGGHSLALKRNGTLWAWGSNWAGQVGDDTKIDRSLPVQVLGLSDVVAVAAGCQHSIALKKDGTVWTWGGNREGQIGDGTNEFRSTPVLVSGVSDVLAVAAGAWFSMALKRDGTIWTWGEDIAGQLGDGSTWNTNSPAQVPGLSDITAIAAGLSHSLALKRDGTVWIWGSQWGTSPESIGLSDVKTIASGGDFSLALKRDGTVWTWGGNSAGQLGDGTIQSNYYHPAQVPGLSKLLAISGGSGYSLILKSDGTVWGWGAKGSGQLGDGAMILHTIPLPVQGITNVTLVAAGSSHFLALKSDGSAWAWGNNDSGQLGNGSHTGGSTPGQVVGLSDVVGLAGGGGHSLALKRDGTVWSWGLNGFRQLGDGTHFSHSTPVQVPGITDVVAVAAGPFTSLALKRDGTVWGWGNNEGGQLGNGTNLTSGTPVQAQGLSDIVQIAIGGTSLALKRDGTVWAWGGNVGDGTSEDHLTPVQVQGLTDVKSVATGCRSGFNLALRNDGTIWAWGDNTYGQLGDGTTKNRLAPVPVQGLDTDVLAISAGNSFSVALKRDGTVWTWGWNGSGQLGDGTFVDRHTPVLTVNESITDVLDLIPSSVNQVPTQDYPPFLLETIQSGDLANLKLSFRVNLASIVSMGLAKSTPRSLPPGMNLYVAANAPPGAKTPVCAPQMARTDPTWWVWENENPGKGNPLVWPMGAFQTNVPENYDIPQVLIAKCDLHDQEGTTIYVGYGTSADEMLSVWRLREIYRVP